MKNSIFLSCLEKVNERFSDARASRGRLRIAGWLWVVLILAFGNLAAQPPSHDPSTMIRNTDGRYWIFTTGDGIWCMSSSNADFTNWRAEPAPFANGYPGWINNYVPGFSGHFWAPDAIRIGNYFYLYYSCSTFGSSRSAIGVARASSLGGPWTDLGVVVSSNGGSNEINAIDPALFRDTNGRIWMSYGSFFGGIGIVEINSSTGKAIGSVTRIAGGNHQSIEAPFIMKNGSYYYLFLNRGSCCQGLNSSYYITVSRSTNVTGPYSGERTFVSNSNGRYVGPGHAGYGEGRLTYHFYDGNDNGAAKLRITTMGWSGGWPVAGGSGSGGSSNFYQLQNRGTGLFLDGMGRTVNGDACGQYGNTSHVNSQWELIDVGGGYSQLKNRGTGLFLDGMGRTANGDDVGQWANTNHYNSHWALQQFDGSYYRLQNRGTGLYLDGMGRTSNGANCGQWGNTTHPNAQWRLVNVSARVASEMEQNAPSLTIYPNPVATTLNIQWAGNEREATVRILNVSGQLMLSERLSEANSQIDVKALAAGVYVLEIATPSRVQRSKLIKR